MTVRDIYNFLDEKFPFSSALDYDNSGLLIGDAKQTVLGAVVCLDCTHSTIELAEKTGAQLIITHHPVIFDPVRNVLKGDIVHEIIKRGISVISAHTNLDTADGGVNDALANALSLQNIEKIVCSDGSTFRKGSLNTPMTADELAEFAGKILGIKPRYTAGNKKIHTVAVCGGSGGNMISDAVRSGADAYITGDIKHHIFVYAANIGFTVMDCGHFATEQTVIEPLTALLSAKFNNIRFYADRNLYIKSL